MKCDGCMYWSELVAEAISNTNKALDELSAVIGDLGNRLDRAMREPSPQDPGENEKKEEYLVPIASEIRAISYTINDQISRIRDFLDRLEV